MHFGSLNSSLFALLTGLAPGGSTSAPLPTGEGPSFAEALQGALGFGALPVASATESLPAAPATAPLPAVVAERPGTVDGSAAPDAVELEVTPLLSNWVPRDVEVSMAPGDASSNADPPPPAVVVPETSDANEATPAPAEPSSLEVKNPTLRAATIFPAAVVVAFSDGVEANAPTLSQTGESVTLEGASLELASSGAAETSNPAPETAPAESMTLPPPLSMADPAAGREAPPTEPAPLAVTPPTDEAPGPDSRVTADPPPLRPSEVLAVTPATDRSRPAEILRSLSNIFPRDVEIQVDRAPRERPVVGAATLVRDLGQSLATRAVAVAPVRTSAVAVAVTPAPATQPIPEPTPAANALAALSAASTVDVAGPRPAPAPDTANPPAAPIPTPVDRDVPVRREMPLPAATEPVPAVSASNVGAETGRQDADSTPEGTTLADTTPPTAPAPAVDAAAPAPVPTSGPVNDLQMQVRQAVAQTVVRMGEDQLLASARPTGVRLQLSPSHLGQIQIEVSQNPQRGLDVTIHAAVEETQRALEADADDLLDSLRSQKLDVARVSVKGEGDRSEGDPRSRSDAFRNRDQGARDDFSTADGEGEGAHDRGGQSRGGQQPPHADPTDYRYWEAIR